MTIPVFGSSGPGEQIPMPRTTAAVPFSCSFAVTESMADITAARPEPAPLLQIIGPGDWYSMAPDGPTSPAAIFVQPMSTPMTPASRDPEFVMILVPGTKLCQPE